MKLRTSYFNITAFRKNLTRFAPVWVLHTVLLLLFLGIMADSYVHFADSIITSIQPMAVFNLIYALLCGELLFGDLFNTRMCNALHAMPMRREGWFLTHVLSALVFALIPYLTVTVLAMPMLQELWYVPLCWLAAAMLQFLFFFGVAAFSALCVGQRFAMALVYLIVNFFSLIALWLIDTLYVPMLYGMEINTELFYFLCPVYAMAGEFQYVDVSWSRYSTGVFNNVSVTLTNGWGYLGLCALLGLALTGIALLLYRKRHLECAGDFIAVRHLSPVFLVLYTLCAGTACHLFFYIFFSNKSMAFLLIGMAIGFFTGKMLLERTVRVLQGKNFLKFAALLVIFGVSLALTWLDPVGITRWVPKVQEVTGVTIHTTSGYTYNRSFQYVITDPADIEQILSVHSHALANREADVNGHEDVTLILNYTLKNGTTATREYCIDVNTPAGRIIRAHLSTPEYIFGEGIRDLDAYVSRLIEIRVDGNSVNTYADMRGLVEAIILDCEAGKMAQDWGFHTGENAAMWLDITSASGNNRDYHEMIIYDHCINTINWLKAHNLTTNYDEKYG